MIFAKILTLLILCYILVHVGSLSEDEFDEVSLPEHEFVADVKRKTNPDGTVETKTTITLHQGPYKMSRTKTRKNAAYMSCRNKKKGCKAKGT